MTSSAVFQSAATTHPGNVRTANEDSHLLHDAAGLWAVADGMGGHEAGDMASRMLTDALLAISEPGSAAELLARCEACVVDVNDRLLRIADERGTVIGTTLAMLLSFDVHYACVWSGDSRIYLVRDGQISMLSRDHTEVQDLVDRGILTVEESRISPRRNVITRAIGVSPRAELELAQGTLQREDTFLLCSDGLTNHVSDDELQSHARMPYLQAACDALIDLALARGGSDNVTVIVVRYLGPMPPSVRSRPPTDTVVDVPEPATADGAIERGRV